MTKTVVGRTGFEPLCLWYTENALPFFNENCSASERFDEVVNTTIEQSKGISPHSLESFYVKSLRIQLVHNLSSFDLGSICEYAESGPDDTRAFKATVLANVRIKQYLCRLPYWDMLESGRLFGRVEQARTFVRLNDDFRSLDASPQVLYTFFNGYSISEEWITTKIPDSGKRMADDLRSILEQVKWLSEEPE
jgi:hypothetical protein